MARAPYALGLGLAAALVYGGAVGCNTAAMLHPPVVASGLPQKDDRQLVLETLAEYEWVVESEEPGAIVARYTKGRASATVRITYGAGDIQIAYVDSQNLKCQPAPTGGCTTIHKAYNRWVNNLYRDIGMRVAARR